MTDPAPEMLFGPFVYDGEIRVHINESPELEQDQTVEELEEELARAKSDAAKAKIEIEQTIHALRPDGDAETSIPPFALWWQAHDESLNLDEALDKYVLEFDLIAETSTNEAERAAVARAKLKALNSSDIAFEGEDAEMLETYRMSLLLQTRGRNVSRPPEADSGTN